MSDQEADHLLAVDVASTQVEANRPTGRRAEPRERKTVLHSLSAAASIIRSNARRIIDGEGDLAELAALHELISTVRQAEDNVASHLLDGGASYREIGAALRISLQAVAQRHPGKSGRPAGGQRAADR